MLSTRWRLLAAPVLVLAVAGCGGASEAASGPSLAAVPTPTFEVPTYAWSIEAATPTFDPLPTTSSLAPVPETLDVPEPTSEPEPTGSTVRVTQIIDGDTFVAGGRKIRVLGIDSCEAGTPGSREATAAARGLLAGKSVTLRSEPGVDTDRYQRQLRYVTVDGRDFGSQMVRGSHTGIYRDGGDASAAYVADLRALDDGRDCGQRAPASSTRAAPTAQDEPGPAVSGKKPRTGNSGHPCLPGERDGDGDGYCKEG